MGKGHKDNHNARKKRGVQSLWGGFTPHGFEWWALPAVLGTGREIVCLHSEDY